MSEEYKKMWSELGLDLKAHDALLDAVGTLYKDVYISQDERPAGMHYFDFVMSEVHGLRIKELVDARKEGRKIIGSYCVFVPEEIILALDGVSIGLCAGAEFAFQEVEKYLPRNTCSLIKSMFGFKLAKVCPYIEASDMIVGENTCDGKKKSYEVFNTIVDNLYVMDIPQVKSDMGKALLKAEYVKFAEKLEKLTGRKLETSRLKKSIEIVNNKRKAVQRIRDLRSADPSPISGLDSLLINQVFFYDDPVRFTDSANKIADELEQRIKDRKGPMNEGAARILISGCPMALPNWKVPNIIEQSGAIIVGEESCVGERGSSWITDDNGNTVVELIENIVDRYWQINCAVFTPNPDRLDKIKQLYKKYNAQGVLHYNLEFCQPYQIESGIIENELETSGIPVLRIDTDYSLEDAGQIQTRIEAFVERLKE